MKKRKKVVKVYVCGVDWQCEIPDASDLEGKVPLYYSVEECKRQSPCWEECGIVELELTLNKWIEPQDLFRKQRE
jgi:hypothetical protein